MPTAVPRRSVGFTDLDDRSITKMRSSRQNASRKISGLFGGMTGVSDQAAAPSGTRRVTVGAQPQGGAAGPAPVGGSGLAQLAAAQQRASVSPTRPVSQVPVTGPQGGVGQGGNGSQLPYNGDPWTGFAGQYVPGRQDDIFANPGIVLQDVLRGMGIDQPAQSGYYAELEPLADVINEIMLLQNPNAQGSGESAVNYFNTFFKNMSTPGGRAPDFDILRANLEGADPTNSLGLFLGGANDQRTQVQNFLKLGRAAAEIGLHPYYADAFNQLMAVAANDYMNAGAKGETAQFGDYWNQNYGNYMR